ncbi:MAG: LuxR C-terminal-related transcriptional regulator [Anaerolineales bacterium]
MDENKSSGSQQIIPDDLTWRERDILNLLAERLTNREIAERLVLAESTVKDYVSRILGKLYVKNRRQAVSRAKELGLFDSPQPATAPARVNLPAAAIPFIGRRDEVETVKQLLRQTRLLTLSGPGGMGKTRLAMKAAEEAAGDFPDGVFFVSLAPIHSADHIVQTVAEAVNFPTPTHEDPKVQLLRYLQKKQFLLVMDNFEHLMDGAGIVSDILRAAPRVKILATSRQKLNLHSETNLVIGGMKIDRQAASDNDALAMFMQSANKVRPGFDPSPDELAKVADG